MKKRIVRKITKWDVIVAVIIIIMGIIGGYIGYSYPDHPILGKNKGFFIFLIITGIMLWMIEKVFAIDKKRKKNISEKEEKQKEI
jgi:uncharacterized membrane protein YfcA